MPADPSVLTLHEERILELDDEAYAVYRRVREEGGDYPAAMLAACGQLRTLPPGYRLVDGEVFYSAAWLNDPREVAS